MKTKTTTDLLLRGTSIEDYKYLRALKDNSGQKWGTITSAIIKFLKANKFSISVKVVGKK